MYKKTLATDFYNKKRKKTMLKANPEMEQISTKIRFLRTRKYSETGEERKDTQLEIDSLTAKLRQIPKFSPKTPY